MSELDKLKTALAEALRAYHACGCRAYKMKADQLRAKIKRLESEG